jgi:UDP-N-acetylglucosamine acyltransferase
MYGLNSVGLRRHGFSDRGGSQAEPTTFCFDRHRMAEAARLAKAEFGDQPDVMAVLAFLEGTKRGICRSIGKDEEDENRRS